METAIGGVLKRLCGMASKDMKSSGLSQDYAQEQTENKN